MRLRFMNEEEEIENTGSSLIFKYIEIIIKHDVSTDYMVIKQKFNYLISEDNNVENKDRTRI